MVVCIVLVSPVMARAQEEAVISGKVVDSSGGVLPGVTVRAVHEASGNAFDAVTDNLGAYRIQVRVGTVRVTAELSGFTAATRAAELRLGQTVVVNLQMSPAGVAEQVTVSAEAPLIETTTSTLGGNVDPRQVAELPSYGRNWMQLAMLAPGSRTQPVAPSRADAERALPDRNGGEVREFQVNVDGQQVTSDFHQAQPKYSTDSIAEFQYISNRFDATQGRSTSAQVNVITKSGTNQLAGLVRANFRNSRFNAPNRVLGRVEPIDNQQLSTTLGGPVLKDRLHYFVNYEYEREPRVGIWLTPYPAFNNPGLEGDNHQKKAGARIDYQLSSRARLMGKVSGGRYYEPFGQPSATNHPASTNTTEEYNDEYLGHLTQVVSNRAVNEVRGGRTKVGFFGENLTKWSNHWYKDRGVTTGSPRITFTGFAISGNSNLPRRTEAEIVSARDDFTYSFSKQGRHDLRTGAEYLYRTSTAAQCRSCMGVIDARGGPLPSAAQLAAWFPDPFNVDTWNLAAISSITRSYSVGVGNFTFDQGSNKIAGWAQDDWQITNHLTLNLGVRYDIGIGIFANDISFPPFQEAGRPNDWNNVQPRFGFAYRLNDRTVIRGGSGLYFGDTISADQASAVANTQVAVLRFENDGRPDFAANPTNGRPLPTFEQALPLYCDNNNVTGCLIRDVGEFTALPEYVQLPRTWETSIGLERQLGNTASVEADYVYSQGRHEKDVVDNVNLLFDQNTGANLDFRVRTNRPFPNWGVVSMNTHTGRSAYHGLVTGFTKRFSRGWQASASYTLSGLWSADSRPFSGLHMVTFPTAPDLGGQWGFSETDQRHRAVFSAIWQVGHGFQVSGMHYLGAGIRQPHNYGGDLRNTGATFSGRLRADGSITPLNDILAPTQNRTDLRIQQRITLNRRFAIDGIAEVFNMFDRPNWAIGTQENVPSQFLRHTNAQYRTAQFGFRVTF
jgi:hypothetical protein